MNIQFHDLQRQYQLYKNEINTAINETLDSCQFIMGAAVKTFEEELGKFLGNEQVISCSNGTDALLLALMAIGIEPGDEVITTPFTFISTAEVICLLGAKPVFVDIEPDTYNIDPNQIQDKITHKTRVIMPVSLYGQPADMDSINELAAAYSFTQKLYVIEDAAQSLGAEYKNRKSGNLADFSCLSFFPTKPLGCYGDGGAVVVKDPEHCEKLKSLRVHGQIKRYHHKYIGVNARLDTMQAAILRVKLKYFAEELQKRAQIAEIYNQKLAQLNLKLPMVKSDRTSVYAQYSILSPQRAIIMDKFKEKKIPFAIHYPKPLHLQECFKNLGYKVGDFPVAEDTAQKVLSLPMSAFVLEKEQEYIAKLLAESLSMESINA